MPACPLCRTPLDPPFLERRAVPVVQNVLIDSAHTARAIPRGDLTLAHCPGCDFVTNVAYRPGLIPYDEGYENVQIFSGVFERYVDGLVDRLVTRGVRGRRVVELGCGTGYFLHKLCERGGNTGLGFDTTYRGPAQLGERVHIERDYYDESRPPLHAGAVISRHVIEHLPDPLALLRSMRKAGNDEALVVVETPSLEWVLEGVVYQDFFYEHCSYFSERSLPFALRRAGLEPVAVQRVFGDQYLWVEAEPARGGRGGGSDPEPPGARLGPLIERYCREEKARLDEARRRVAELAARGPVAVWGAGAKGVTFLNLVDPDCTAVTCAIDVNPAKQGRFVPGTGHPIEGVEALVTRGVRSVLLMNPNYLDESRRLARARGVEVEFSIQDTGWV